MEGYLGMLFTVIKNKNSKYNMEVVYDSTGQLSGPDSLIFHFESGPPISFILKKSRISDVDGNLKQSIVQLDLSNHHVTAFQQRKLKFVSAYAGTNLLVVDIYNDLFLSNQFRCLAN